MKYIYKYSMPHGDVNPDGAVFNGTDIPVSAYDWLVELIPHHDSHSKYIEKIKDAGWDVNSFKNYRSWVISNYGNNLRDIMLGKDDIPGFLEIAPLWDRTNSKIHAPIGWWDWSKSKIINAPKAKGLEDKSLSATANWIRSFLSVVK